MGAFFIAIIISCLVAFMAMDKLIRQAERRALSFLVVLMLAFVVVGIVSFELKQIAEVAIKDWFGLFLMPVLVVKLQYMTKTSKEHQVPVRDLQSEHYEAMPFYLAYRFVNVLYWSLAVAWVVLVTYSNL